EFGLAGLDQDGAANRVAAEQRALRAAQHFYAANIAEFDGPADRAADIYFVDVNADAGVHGRCGIELADAADEHDRSGAVARKLAGRLELQTGGELFQILRLGDLAVFQRFAAEHGDRNRRFLQGFVAAARGNDN